MRLLSLFSSRAAFLCSLLLGACALSASPAQAADPHKLWEITSQQCLPNMQSTGQPQPCVMVDLARGFVVLKDTTPGEDIEYVAATRTLVPGVTNTGQGQAAAAAPVVEEPAVPEEFEMDPNDV